MKTTEIIRFRFCRRYLCMAGLVLVSSAFLFLLGRSSSAGVMLGSVNGYRGVDIQFTSPEKTVVSWAKNRCTDTDVPDYGFRAFKRYDGNVIGFATEDSWYPLIAPKNISNKTDAMMSMKKISCNAAFKSPKKADPSLFDDQSWAGATWTDDGKNVAVLSHHEYHAENHMLPNGHKVCRSYKTDSSTGKMIYGPDGVSPRQCRYAALTLYSSGDGGYHFKRRVKSPIASIDMKQDLTLLSVVQGADLTKPPLDPFLRPLLTEGIQSGKTYLLPFEAGPTGPTNLVEGKDHYKYTAIRMIGKYSPTKGVQYKTKQYSATCMMRTKNPFDPASWEIYNGTQFIPSRFNPYTDNLASVPVCAPITGLRTGFPFSLLYHPGKDLFIALSVVPDPSVPQRMRLATSISNNMIAWTEPHLIKGINLEWNGFCNRGNYVLHYPSLIDPSSDRRNFDTTDNDLVLFMSKIKRNMTPNAQGSCVITQNRDLVARKVSLKFY